MYLDPTIQQIAMKAKSDKRSLELIMKSLFAPQKDKIKEK